MPIPWQFLEYIGLPDSRTYAEQCVKKLLGKNLISQLLERRVLRYEKQPLFARGILTLTKENRGFSIVLWDFYTQSDLYDQCFTFAHELGHTFCFDIQRLIRLPHTNPKNDKVLPHLEQFADEFAFIWLSYNNQFKELQCFLKKHATDICVDLTQEQPSN